MNYMETTGERYRGFNYQGYDGIKTGLPAFTQRGYTAKRRLKTERPPFAGDLSILYCCL
jgi:hypothetical protein